MSTSERVTAFVTREFAQGRPINVDTPLLGDVIDSLGTFVLVEFIEKEFAVSLLDSDLTVDNLGSVRSISALIDRKADQK